MGLKENLKTMEELDKVVEKRDWDGFSRLHTESVVSYSPINPAPVKGIEAHRKSIEAFMSAFPDFQMKRGLVFGDGDWVFAEYVFTGTHKGPMNTPDGKTIPPTNKSVRFELATTGRFENGKLAEEHTYFDRLSMLTQLGIKP
jgi:predicted ester cyclase